MKIIPEALELAKLQRTDMSEGAIIKSYQKDFEEICGNVDLEKVTNILDIGCGLAGSWCFLRSGESLHLIDKTENNPNLHYGFHETTPFYNSMFLAKANLIANGIDEESIFLQEAEDNKIKFNVEFDLVTSFISCGFHYPVETYLDQIYDKLKVGGTLIIDLRKGTDGINKVTNKFGNYKMIREEAKYLRVKAVK